MGNPGDRARSKVLAVTGRLAEQDVRASQARSNSGADVLVLDVDVAAFITPDLLLRSAPTGYDLILIPGAITADFSRVERALGTKIRLGPKHAVDLAAVLDHLDGVELSTEVPACVLLAERIRESARTLLGQIEEEASPALTVKGKKIGGASRMKVLAEVVDATRMDSRRLALRIEQYEEAGADMIDLGVPLDAAPEQVSEAVKTALGSTDLPVSVDTTVPSLILAGVEAGADMVLSLNGDNMEKVADAVEAASVPVVVIPGPERKTIDDNVNSALRLGLKAIADPVLSPPMQGLAESISRYLAFSRSHPDFPIFFGAGNATELIDTDSHGVNAILAAIGSEIGASILFTPEYSPKAKGSVRELRVASDMMALASVRHSPPKDLGIDLLRMKEKRRRPDLSIDLEHAAWAQEAQRPWKMDPAGPFRIGLSDDKIVAVHEKAVVTGRSARDILNTIIEMDLITRLDHAGYLGRELERAEIALLLGRSYSQDDDL